MRLEIPEIKIKEGQDICNIASYPAPGMYIVDDGIMKHLAWFPVGGAVILTPIPSEILEQYAAAKERIGVRDKLSEEIHEMKAVIGAQKPDSGFVSENALLKALAIVQNPELARDLLK